MKAGSEECRLCRGALRERIQALEGRRHGTTGIAFRAWRVR